MSGFWDNIDFVRDELQKVNKIIKRKVRCSEKTIESALIDIFDNNGKMLRPGFVILAASFGEYDSDKMTQIAAAVEMFHNATLIHDDILDDSKIRRNMKTVQEKYGKEAAVLIGDFLLSRCMSLLTVCDQVDTIKGVIRSMERLSVGEINQMMTKKRTDVSINSYLKRIAAKTAILFSLSFFIGAVESRCSKDIANRLKKIGFDLGMAFQIKDDILDLIGDRTFGKSIGHDLMEGIYTLPVIYALRHDKELEEILSSDKIEDLNYLIDRIIKNGGIEYSEGLAKRYTSKALKNIETLPNNSSKLVLKEIALQLAERKY
ncbi:MULTISPECIES: polyprenyl synthetase family protein [Caloramator]|uniref:Heptaprenyl diphosphate synthase component II n=1 Tax=Caloramator australicus RC3 TaxID=857293 RepID=I7KVS7_9CLOT|nr:MULTISPECIES: polyprenyl synthetase family protein [Caloramator]MDO6353952.1 polyprenyl synthetase family protein [Caloramator sp. CAR-1]CCJ34169.1 Heptaprenyl diphosphate synthase component II [Caloramator australicus RC3]